MRIALNHPMPPAHIGHARNGTDDPVLEVVDIVFVGVERAADGQHRCRRADNLGKGNCLRRSL